MSAPTWQDSLTRALVSQRPSSSRSRIAIVGVGSELRGDDAAGILIARALLESRIVESKGLRACESTRLLILEGGTAPENLTGSLRRFRPDLVLLIDAADMGETPGATHWLEPHDTTGFMPSTHMLPLHLLTRYLENELGCTVALLGIQPENLEFGSPLSAAVENAVRATAQAIAQLWVPSDTI